MSGARQPWRLFTTTMLASLVCGCASRSQVSITTPATHATINETGVYRHGAVAADHPIASEAGAQMLRKGGNAVDAAVATSFCLSVVRPFSCGIGGGGFMVVWLPPNSTAQSGQAIAINYRETCPAAVGPEFYADLDDKTASKYGWRASGVPGSVAGLCLALEQYGSLDLKTVLEPAIRAAENGFLADEAFVRATRQVGQTIESQPAFAAALGPIWADMCRSGQVQVGDVIRNPDQVRALKLIARHGPRVFYEGEIALAIDRTMREHHGTLTLTDLKGYRVRETKPLIGSFREYEIVTMPPPSSGGVAILQILGMLNYAFSEAEDTSMNSSDYVQSTTEAMKHAFADRSRWLADPDFVDLPMEALLADEVLRAGAKSIDINHTQPPDSYGLIALPEDGGTSHLCAIDADGMAVSCTETINLEFGSLVCVPGFGFCLNNEMDDFTTARGAANAFGLQQSNANLPQPGKRPLSSMSPTIVLRDGKVAIIAGGSGGPRIISATTQCLLNVMMFSKTPEQAVSAPRFHHQWMPNVLLFDARWTDKAVIEQLQARGHETGQLKNESAIQMIAVDENDGTIRAACDPRKGGRPDGY